ncbi:hypothetical protein CLV80_104100 [Yoonia maritima]|uniref:Uncharacterized protein n=1 Tax=Yoonia maritima TaxID=1435347 RepID=A0A2T0W055_9RHOB|nr:hypothetical protein CLV80_104100 [Yoonia maritima]
MLDVVLIALLSVVVIIGSPLSNARGKAAVDWLQNTVKLYARRIQLPNRS